MRNSAMLVVLVMLGSVLAGCFEEQYEKSDYTQEKMDLYVYEFGILELKIDSCPFLPYPSVTEPIIVEGTNIRPYNAINPDGQYEIYEPSDISDKFVITYVEGDLSDFYMNTQLLHQITWKALQVIL